MIHNWPSKGGGLACWVGCPTVLMHVDDIKQALAIKDAAMIRNGFVALVTEARVAGLATANGMALLDEVAAALKDLIRRHCGGS
jgi:hypothetical protein